MRILWDKILRMGIKLCMLTGVAFTFAACYAPTTPPDRWIEPEYKQDQEQVEQQIQAAHDQTDEQEAE